MKKGRRPQRFRGLFLHVIAFLFLALPAVFVFLLPTPPVKHAEGPVFEDFSRVPVTPHLKKKQGVRTRRGKRLPLVAIIIDDMGFDYTLDRKFIFLEAPLSFAFLPYGPNTGRLASTAHSMNRDVLVHLPMEPENRSIDPGPGVLTVDMGLDAMLETLKKNISQVPGAIGVNNHMGSKFTADRKAMEYVLAFLKQRGLFFVDSRTTKKTIAYETARQMGVPCGERSVFLDHVDKSAEIRHEVHRLVSLAKRNGSAIAIGHPYKNTYKVLYKMLPLMRREVKIVPVHTLVR